MIPFRDLNYYKSGQQMFPNNETFIFDTVVVGEIILFPCNSVFLQLQYNDDL
jgi:hypothetical protein